MTLNELYNMVLVDYGEVALNKPISFYYYNPDTNLCVAEPDLVPEQIENGENFLFINENIYNLVEEYKGSGKDE